MVDTIFEFLFWLRRVWMRFLTFGAWDEMGEAVLGILNNATVEKCDMERDLRQRINVLDFRLTELMRVIEQNGVVLKADLMDALPSDEMLDLQGDVDASERAQARVVEVPRPPGSAPTP